MPDLLHVEVAAVCQRGECSGIEVPSMSGDIEMQPILLEELRLERLYVGNGHHDRSVRFNETPRLSQRCSRIVQMLEHVPKGNQIERCFRMRGVLHLLDADSIAQPLRGACGDRCRKL